MEKKFLMIPAFMLLLSVLAISFYMQPSVQSNIENSINYGGSYCISTTGNFEGRQTPLGENEIVLCDHNVLYDTGAEGIEQLVGAGGASDAFDWIELCNASTDGGTGCGEPIAGKTETYNAFSACGMSKVAGTYGNLGNGNWSIWTTFTSTCDNVETNMTRLLNGADVDLAGNKFTMVTLQTSDTLTINRTLWVS